MIKKFALFLVIFSLSACVGKIFSEKSFFAPKPLLMGSPDKSNPNTPPEYTQGWDDGCQTGLSTMNPGYYKSFYAFKQDPYKADNEVYYKAWKDAYTYCRQYSFRYVWEAYDRNNAKALDNNLCVLCPNELSRTQ
jgi:hypothetical protein